MPSAFALRRRARFARRQVMPEDPDNSWRELNCTQQMQVFDRLPAPVRERIRDGADNTDTVDLVRSIENRGPSDRVRAILKARGVMACDVPPDELIALEFEHG